MVAVIALQTRAVYLCALGLAQLAHGDIEDGKRCLAEAAALGKLIELLSPSSRTVSP